MMRTLKALGGLLLAGTLVACGGGGGSAGSNPNNPGGGQGATPPAAVEVFTSAAELSTASASSITFTVLAKDANNNALPGQTVTFSANSGNLVGAQPAPATGPAGEPVTSVSLQPGTDRSNRDITVNVTAGGVTRQVVIPVTGTTLSLAGDSSVLLGGNASYTARAADSAGQPIAGATLTLTSSLGNALSPQTATTNAQGAATFAYTGTRAGNDVLTVRGLGASATATVAISADQFSFETPASGASIAVGASQAVGVRLLAGGSPVVGQTVTFNTTRGTLSPAVATTDASGRASTVVTSNSSGPATVSAQTASAQVNLPVNFVATQPANLVLQANPGAVAPNAAGATTNQATLLATVRDPSGNPVAGRVVNFTALDDPSNGSIAPASAVTDAGGQAQAQFIAGPLSTANNGVRVQATVQGSAISGTAALTVNAQALFISIGTGNVINNVSPTVYSKEYSVYVTDANGAPAANRVVALSVYPDVYSKGRLAYNGTTWEPVSPVACANEDVDRDGILDPGEDTNGDNRLTPGLPVSVSPGSVTTNASGFATFTLQYGENFAPWLSVTITARTAVGGTESVKSAPFPIVGAASDFTEEDIPPAGVISPFGVGASCTDPN